MRKKILSRFFTSVTEKMCISSSGICWTNYKKTHSSPKQQGGYRQAVYSPIPSGSRLAPATRNLAGMTNYDPVCFAGMTTPEPWTLNPEPFFYWFPSPFCSPQSGHCQVMALQDIPQIFSYIQAWQIWKPHRHRQQKRNSFLQQWQVKLVNLRRKRRYTVFVAGSFMEVVVV